MADLIPAHGYVAVFTGLAPDGQTTYHQRPLIAWTIGDDDRLAGHYVNGNGQSVIAGKVPNFHRYMTEDEWEIFRIAQFRVPTSSGSDS